MIKISTQKTIANKIQNFNYFLRKFFSEALIASAEAAEVEEKKEGMEGEMGGVMEEAIKEEIEGDPRMATGGDSEGGLWERRGEEGREMEMAGMGGVEGIGERWWWRRARRSSSFMPLRERMRWRSASEPSGIMV